MPLTDHASQDQNKVELPEDTRKTGSRWAVARGTHTPGHRAPRSRTPDQPRLSLEILLAYFERDTSLAVRERSAFQMVARPLPQVRLVSVRLCSASRRNMRWLGRGPPQRALFTRMTRECPICIYQAFRFSTDPSKRSERWQLVTVPCRICWNARHRSVGFLESGITRRRHGGRRRTRSGFWRC